MLVHMFLSVAYRDGVRLESGRRGIDPGVLRSSRTSDFKTGMLSATLTGALRYRVSARTISPGASILRHGKIISLICNFCLSDLQLLPQCGSTDPCLSRFVPEIHFACCWDVRPPKKTTTKKKEEKQQQRQQQ